MASPLTLTIATLTPTTPAAFRAMTLRHNARWISQDEPTPEPEVLAESSHQESTPPAQPHEPKFVLSLAQEPREPLLGFHDDSECDIVLASQPSAEGVSRVHFRIGFNSASRALMVYDLSSHFTVLMSNTLRRKAKLVRQAAPIFDNDIIQAGHASFRVNIPHRDDHGLEIYEQNLYKFLENELPQMENLSTRQRDVQTYFPVEELILVSEIAHGSSAKVYKAIDGNGSTYAVKIFMGATNMLKHDEMATLKREIDALLDLKHVCALPMYTHQC